MARRLQRASAALVPYCAAPWPMQAARVRWLFGFARGEPPEPTVPARPEWRSATDTPSGPAWLDEYSWLERGGPEVQAVLRQELRHAEAWLRRCAPLAAELHEEMLRLTPNSQVSAPERVAGHDYFVRQLPGAPHPCFLRRPARGGGEQLVLDVNALAAAHGERVSVGQLKLSRCGGRVAFTLDGGDGGEAAAAFVRDLAGGAPRHLAALGGVASLEWAADGRTLLATQPNALGRPWRVVGCDAAPGGSGDGAWPLHEEPDERFFLDLGRTKDWSFLTINANSKASSEVHLLPAGLRAPDGRAAAPRLVQRRTPGLEYFAEHAGGQLYLLSNARGETNYAVFRVPVDSPDLGEARWVRVVGEREAGGALEDLELLRGWLVLHLRRAGRPRVAALPLRGGLPLLPEAAAAAPDARAGAGAAAAVAAAAPDAGAGAGAAAAAAACRSQGGSAAAGSRCGGSAASAGVPAPAAARAHAGAAPGLLREAPLPGWALSVGGGANADFESGTLRLLLSSPVHPEAAFDWHLGSGRLEERRAEGGRGVPGAPPAGRRDGGAPRFVWRRLWARGADGAAVPLTVAHDGAWRGPPPSPRPCLLVAYGAYGHCLPTDYAPQRLPLLSRGWVLALAHVRGGGELGRAWHAAGRGAAAAASAADLGACLDHLVARGYTARGLVALEAHSAGGVAAGGLLAAAPAALGAALLEAPFVDVLSAMARPELPLTTHEYDEWGDPRVPGQLAALRCACPYQALRAAPYPPLLLTTSQSDARVPFWGPLKFAARARSLLAAADRPRPDGARGGPVLLLPDAHEGHFVHERDVLRAKAQQYAFLALALAGGLR